MAEHPEFCIEEVRTCVKPRKCVECGGSINPGSVYHLVKGKWEGQFEEFYWHPTCYGLYNEMITYLKKHTDLYPDELPGIGQLVEYTEEEARELGDFPSYWPEGVYISQKALKKYVE